MPSCVKRPQPPFDALRRTQPSALEGLSTSVPSCATIEAIDAIDAIEAIEAIVAIGAITRRQTKPFAVVPRQASLVSQSEES